MGTHILTHCGWIEIHVNVDYSAPCCDSDAPQGNIGLATYVCHQTNPYGCDDLSFNTDISNDPTAPIQPPGPGITPTPPVKPIGNDFSFSISSYGSMLPIVYGSDKLNGNVIWASPVTDHVVIIAGESVLYRTVSFALGVCEGEISGVLRMWLSENLFLNKTAEVDPNGIIQPNPDGVVLGFQVDLTDPESPLRSLDQNLRTTTVTVFPGSETQVPEGVIVAAEGYENTPAYRGVAYVLFENFLVADSSVPPISVEVSANVSNLWPRQYTDLDDTTFDTMERFVLTYDIYFDRVYVVASDGGSVFGLAIFDGNTMEELEQQVFPTSNQWSNFVTTLSGLIVNTIQDNNQGIVRVLSPYTGTVLGSLGPGGGLTSHSMTTGFGVLGLSSFICSGFDADGLLIDVFVGVHASAPAIGFATISKSGVITMQSVLNATLPADINVCNAVIVGDKQAAGAPLFYDGFSSRGIHIFGISADTAEKVSLKPWRITIAGATGSGSGASASLAAPVYSALAPLSVDLFAGSGFNHSVRYVMGDTDGCLVFFVIPAALSDRMTRIVKWSPWTGGLLWNTPVSNLPASVQSIAGGQWAELTGNKYCWIDVNGQILEVDLKTGTVSTVLDTLASQELPSNIDAHQFYNGYENSILYFSGITGQKLVKVFVDRFTRTQAPITTIVRDLTRRAGLKPADLRMTDLAVLSVDGYTIKTRKSIRAAFSELKQAFTFDVVESDGKIKYRARGSVPDAIIDHSSLGTDEEGRWLNVTETNDGARIRKINLTYRDIDREYMDNVQSIILDKTGPQLLDSESPIDVSVPIAMTAEKAKGLAEILLYSKEVARTGFEFTLPPSYQYIDPADVVGVTMPDDSTEMMRLRQSSIGADRSIQVTASREDPDIYNDEVNLFGNVGRFTDDEFPALAPRVDVVGLPIGGRKDTDFSISSTSYRLYLAFLNYKPGFTIEKPFTLKLLTPGAGASTYLINPPLDYPTWGFVIDPPSAAVPVFSTDETSELRVRLINTTGAAMASSTMSALLANNQCNLCLVGQELLQFRTAVDEGDDVWLLTGLHRGKLGTDFVFGTAIAGDKFILLGGADAVLDESGIVVVDMPLAGGPQKAYQVILDVNNPFQPTELEVLQLANLRPWSVADMKLDYVGNDAVISWQRRTRYGGEWNDDGSDAVPLNEATETYIVWLFNDPTTFNPQNAAHYLRKVEVTSPAFTYTAAMQTADGHDNTTELLFAFVAQAGSLTGQDVSIGVGRVVDDL